jgi:hypothetical protein
MAGLFFFSSIRILQQSLVEIRQAGAHAREAGARNRGHARPDAGRPSAERMDRRSLLPGR